uniref:glucuronosyltransferase n=1 Tax=Ascaris lumbricoides TaxID=6252 RepID=A0A0M3I776_ASCLU
MNVTVSILLLILIILPCKVHAAMILFHGMHSSRSHIGSMLPLAKALLKAGHDVHFLETTQNKKPYDLPHGITNHFVRLTGGKTFDLRSMWTEVYPPQALLELFTLGDAALHAVLTNHYDEVERVLNTTWDIVFSDELFAMGGFGIAMRNAKINGRPYIMFSTTVLMQLFSWEQALARIFIGRPSMWVPPKDDISYDIENFAHRCRSLYDETVSALFIKYGIENAENKGLLMLGVKDFSFTNLWTNAVYNFQEELNHLAFPAPMSSDIVYVGSHCPLANILPTDLKEFLDDNVSKGTLYIAFGTYVKWSHAPKAILDAFKDMMKEMHQYRVVFVYNGDSLGEMPSHVKVLKWAPQFDILSHSKTVLFISHGGLKSLKEAICSKTSVLYLPLFAEQTHNAAVAMKLGFARSLSKLSLDGEKLLRVVREMLSSTQYTNAVLRVHDIYIDRPMESLSEAVFWTNRSLRIGSRKPTFKRKGMFLSSTTYFYLPHLSGVLFAIIISYKL